MENSRRKLGDLDFFKKILGDSRVFSRQRQILGYFRNFRRCDNPAESIKKFEKGKLEVKCWLACSTDTDKEIFRVSLLKTVLPFLTNQVT